MRCSLLLSLLLPASLGAQSPYLERGNEVEKRYELYRAQLQVFFDSLKTHLKTEARDLLAKTAPPAAVPYGYQILPRILSPQPSRKQTRIVLSPFSWPRTDNFLNRDGPRLDSLTSRLDSIVRSPDSTRRAGYSVVVDKYNGLEAGQKFIASLIHYNRLWQGEVAKHPEVYREFKKSQDAALQRQLIDDALSFGYEHDDPALRTRADSLSERIHAELQKLPTPDFVRLDHQTMHAWVVTMPVYTDISDSSFVETFRHTIESAWHVRDGGDDFRVILDIHRLKPEQLYTQGNVPQNGSHIDVQNHLARFPSGGMILTTGANTIYASGRSIILGPHAIAPSALVHEFGHMLGFKDGYFRSYDDLGADGYEIIEVILDPAEGVATPENGVVTRKHFEEVISEHH